MQLIALIVTAARDVSAQVLACLSHARALNRECAMELGDEKHLDARGHAAASVVSALFDIRQMALKQMKLLRCIAYKAGVPSLQECFKTLADASQHVLDTKAWQVSCRCKATAKVDMRPIARA